MTYVNPQIAFNTVDQTFLLSKCDHSKSYGPLTDGLSFTTLAKTICNNKPL